VNDHSSGGGGKGAAPALRSWEDRLDDPDEPLYTVAVVSDLLELDSQTLRRLGDAISHESARPSGNQRRYSRRDIERLASASHLANKGFSPAALAEIHRLEQRVDDLTATQPP
jgi:MerR family transcriptional regulator/heat shock protein HspR